MNVTSIEMTVWEDRGQQTKIKAFASVCFDNEFVVHDIKIIDGSKGLYVVMPSRRLNDQCPMCRAKTPYNDRFCGACGCKLGELEDRQPERDAKGRPRLYADICHPVNSEARNKLASCVMEEYRKRTFDAGIFCSGQMLGIPHPSGPHCSGSTDGGWHYMAHAGFCSGAIASGKIAG